MKKIKITADKILQILQGILADEEINTKVEEQSLQELLNVRYYTFKHRPQDSEQTIGEMHKQGMLQPNGAFCLLSLLSTDRVYAKDIDVVTVGVSLEYWIQTEKVKFLEDMLENLSIETSGKRINLEIDGEDRQVVLAVGGLQVTELDETTVYGEMAICELYLDFVFYPKVTSKVEYVVEFAIGENVKQVKWVELPISSMIVSNSMTQKSLPQINRVENVGNINLSGGRTFSLTFDGYANAFIDEIVAESLAGDIVVKEQESLNNVDINKAIYMRLTRKDKQYIYECVIKEHTVQVQEDTGNEVHSLTLTARGIA